MVFSAAGVSKVSVDIIPFGHVSWYSNFVARCLGKKNDISQSISFSGLVSDWVENHLVLSGSLDYTWTFTLFNVFNTFVFKLHSLQCSPLFPVCYLPAVCSKKENNLKEIQNGNKKYKVEISSYCQNRLQTDSSPLCVSITYFPLFLLYDSIKLISYPWWQVSWHRSLLFPFNFYSHLTRTKETRTPRREDINLLIWKKGHSVVYIQYLNSKESLWKAQLWWSFRWRMVLDILEACNQILCNKLP